MFADPLIKSGFYWFRFSDIFSYGNFPKKKCPQTLFGFQHFCVTLIKMTGKSAFRKTRFCCVHKGLNFIYAEIMF